MLPVKAVLIGDEWCALWECSGCNAGALREITPDDGFRLAAAANAEAMT
jgi:hypothetical protein